jgi:hypothetical protein
MLSESGSRSVIQPTLRPFATIILLLFLGLVHSVGASSFGSLSLQILEERDDGLDLRLDVTQEMNQAGSPFTALPKDTSLFIAVPPQSRIHLASNSTGLLWLSRPVIWMGQRFVALDVLFSQMEPNSALPKSIAIQLQFLAGPGENTATTGRVISTDVAGQLGSSVINPAFLQRRDQEFRQNDAPRGRYLVVACEAAIPFLSDWSSWKTSLGYDVEIISSQSIGAVDLSWEPIRQACADRYFDGGLDFLLIVGDMKSDGGEWHVPSALVPGGPYAEWLWNRRIVTDHPLVLLEGDDYFADVQVGRLPVSNATQLMTALNRGEMYERMNLHEDNSWLQEGLMIFDTSGAGSRRETSLAIRQMLLADSYTTVDTIRNNRETAPISPTQVTARFNEGVGVVNYRGYGYRNSWNGPLFNSDHIMDDLSNVGKWPLVTSIVCGGGDFGTSSYSPCLGEAFLLSGSPNAPLGAIAFIGPSEEDTHTRWNNALDLGIYHGLLHGAPGAGALNDRGKLELWLNFPFDREEDWQEPGSSSQAENVPFYFHCYNLLGDPGLQIRKVPLQLLHPMIEFEVTEALHLGSNHLSLTLRDDLSLPLEGLCAVLEGEDELIARAFSQSSGEVFLQFEPLQSGTLELTISGGDLQVYSVSFEVGEALSNVILESYSFSSDELDLRMMNGQERTLILQLSDVGLDGTEESVLHLLSEDMGILRVGENGSSTSVELPAMQAGESVEVSSIVVRGGPGLIDGLRPTLRLTLETSDGTELLSRPLAFEATGPRVILREIDLLSGTWEAGSTTSFRLQMGLENDVAISDGRLQLFSQSTALTINTGVDEDFALVPMGTEWAGSFYVHLDDDLLAPQPLPCEAVVFNSEGHTLARIPFHLPRPDAEAGDPFGPDDAGYIVYHSDDDSPLAPEFIWESLEDIGQELPLRDQGVVFNPDGIDGVSQEVELPFPFGYYGQMYETVTVCSNGWLAFGSQEDHILGLNTAIPAAQGPDAMVAVFWTDLYNTYDDEIFGHLYVHHDEDRHSFRVQWNAHTHTGYPYQSNWFECELRDPAWWETETGDGEILMHFEEIRGTLGENFFTTGIEAPDQQSGLQVAFAGHYEPASQEIEDGISLRFVRGAAYEETSLEPAGSPNSLQLFEAYPNPFNPSTQIKFSLEQASRVEWRLFDLLGAEIQQGDFGTIPAGEHRRDFDGTALSSGTYFYQLRGENSGGHFQKTIRLLLLK